MLIVMENRATPEQIKAVCQTIVSLGLEAHEMPGAQRTAICVTGNDGSVSQRHFADLSGIREIICVSKPYKLSSNEVKSGKTMISIGDELIGGEKQVLIAGPLCVEKEEGLTFGIAEGVRNLGIKNFRAACFKARTNPYNFQGVGKSGVKILEKIKNYLGLNIITEVIDQESVSACEEVADALIIESHNMQNFGLLKLLGKSQRAIILKRSISASLEDWLMSAEYILSSGNDKVILCEAGIRTFANYSAHTLDLTVILALRHLTHLPIIIDPSFASGDHRYVIPLAKAGLAVGADGVMIECHSMPSQAISGGVQAISLGHLKDLCLSIPSQLEQRSS